MRAWASVHVCVHNPSILLICWQPLGLEEDLEMTEQARALEAHSNRPGASACTHMQTHSVTLLVIFLVAMCLVPNQHCRRVNRQSVTWLPGLERIHAAAPLALFLLILDFFSSSWKAKSWAIAFSRKKRLRSLLFDMSWGESVTRRVIYNCVVKCHCDFKNTSLGHNPEMLIQRRGAK